MLQDAQGTISGISLMTIEKTLAKLFAAEMLSTTALKRSNRSMSRANELFSFLGLRELGRAASWPEGCFKCVTSGTDVINTSSVKGSLIK